MSRILNLLPAFIAAEGVAGGELWYLDFLGSEVYLVRPKET